MRAAELSDRAAEAEARAPAARSTPPPVWAQAEARIRAEGRYPPSWFVLLTIAGLIAAVGIFTNSQILIVGAMVVGPEYAAIISVALGIDTADRRRVGVGAGTLVFGFLIAIAVTLAFSLLVRAFGVANRSVESWRSPGLGSLSTARMRFRSSSRLWPG